jgi:hypothetical protein
MYFYIILFNVYHNIGRHIYLTHSFETHAMYRYQPKDFTYPGLPLWYLTVILKQISRPSPRKRTL